jgi:glycosyltransferase involved in cell wall biosynthesis
VSQPPDPVEGSPRHRHEISEPLVSVVIPCYNQAHYLSEALESVLGQGYGRIETFVVDDGSTDNTCSIVERYPQAHYRRQPHQGAAVARNTGIAESSGDLLLFLDADDRLSAWAIETGVQALQAEDGRTACAVGACRDIGSAGEALDAPDQPLVHRDHYLALLKSCFILSGSSVLFSRWCLEAVGGFDPAYPTGDDYDLYLRISRRFPIRCHGRVVTEYRRHSDSLTGDPGRTLYGELGALNAQRSVVQGRGERAALRSGRRNARSRHATALRWRLCAQMQTRDWRGAIASARVLSRNQPAALMQAMVDLWILGLTALRSRGAKGVPTWTVKHGV